MPLVHPHDLAGFMVDHDEHVLVTLAVAGLVDAYTREAVERVARGCRDCVLDPAHDLADAPPRYPHVARRGGLVHLQGEPCRGLLEPVREARAVRCPGDPARMDGPAVRAEHAVGAVAEEHPVPLEVQTAPQSRPLVVAVVVERPPCDRRGRTCDGRTLSGGRL